MRKQAFMLSGYLAVALCCSGSNAAADSLILTGQVVDIRNQAIVSATVSVNGSEHAVGETGNFEIAVKPDTIHQLEVSAPGYYSFVQTFSRADRPGDESLHETLAIPPVTLVPHKEGRRLFVFGGDTMMGRRFVAPRAGEPALIQANSAAADSRAILRHLKPYFELADFASVNLETQLSDTPLTEPLDKSVTFHSMTQIASALRWAGVDYVALGNNHMFDYRDHGLKRTLEALDEAGLEYSGAGASENLARRPRLTTVNQKPVAMLSYVGWAGGFEPNQVAGSGKGGAALGTRKAISEDLRSVPDETLSILQYHSGLEYVSYPPLAEETQLKSAINSGADLAIGHHSHVFQGFDIYKNKLIAYSLGNLVFDQYLYSTQSAILLFAWYDDDRFFRAEVVPLHINGYVPTPATGAFRYDILQRLVRLTDSDNVCWSRSGEHAVFEQCSDEFRPLATQAVHVPNDIELKHGSVRHLRSLDGDPLRPISDVASTEPYRLGLDLLRRGDFEYVGLFDTQDRTWIENEHISILRDDSMVMNISVPMGENVPTGMRVFTRVFSRSAPASISGRIRSSGCARIHFSLQRRPNGMSMDDALLSGPVSEIGQFESAAEEWTNFTMDFDLPRTVTRAIRVLFDVQNCDPSEPDSKVQLDDLSLIEWQTPWYTNDERLSDPTRTQATHIQFMPAQ